MITFLSKTTTERYYREYTGGVKDWEGLWWRTGRSAGNGYLTLEECQAEPLADRQEPYATHWTDTRIVCEYTVVQTTIVD